MPNMYEFCDNKVQKELSTFTKSEPTPQWAYLFSPSLCFTG